MFGVLDMSFLELTQIIYCLCKVDIIQISKGRLAKVVHIFCCYNLSHSIKILLNRCDCLFAKVATFLPELVLQKIKCKNNLWKLDIMEQGSLFASV